MNTKSPYMLFVAPVKKEICKKMTEEEQKLFGIEKLNIPRSLRLLLHMLITQQEFKQLMRLQILVNQLINAFKKRTGCPLIVNTSLT